MAASLGLSFWDIALRTATGPLSTWLELGGLPDMCLLVAYKPGAVPNAAALSRAASRNPDGFGWAIVSGGSIVSHRTMSASEGVASFIEARSRHLDGPALWHARIGTHGTTDITNCHPFPVSGDPLVVLGHNGILPLSPKCGRSDTRVLCDEMLRVSDLDEPGALYWLGEWARGSKLVVLSARPDTASSLYIVNESGGSWSTDEPGVWYSNESHLERVSFGFSPDPRQSSRATGAGVVDLGGLDDLDGLERSPWDYLGPDDEIVECGYCGELWPEFCEWCETCGGDLEGSTVALYVEGGSREIF